MDSLGGHLYLVETWSPQASTVAGAFAALFGFFALFSSGSGCAIAGLIQIVMGLFVIAIEAPLFVPQLAMLAAVGAIFDKQPPWAKVAFYAGLTVIPAFTGCLKGFILGFIASLVVTTIHGLLLLTGRTTPSDDFNFQSSSSHNQSQQQATSVVVQPHDQALYNQQQQLNSP